MRTETHPSAHPFAKISSPAPSDTASVGSLVHLTDWPRGRWAEVISRDSNPENPTLRVVMYTPNGNARYTETLSATASMVVAGKLDIPPTDFISGDVHLADGKLGLKRMRWPTRIDAKANIHIGNPERFH